MFRFTNEKDHKKDKLDNTRPGRTLFWASGEQYYSDDSKLMKLNGGRVLLVEPILQAGAQHNPSYLQWMSDTIGGWLPSVCYVIGTGNLSNLRQHLSVLLGETEEADEK